MVVGTTEELPTEAAVRMRLLPFIQRLNAGAPMSGKAEVTIANLIDRFIAEEHLHGIKAGHWNRPDALKFSTAHSYLIVLEKYIRPRWGALLVGELQPVVVQAWLAELALSPKSKANIKGLLHRLYEKAMLWGVLGLQRNPIELIEVKGTSRRTKTPVVLAPDQFSAVVERLEDPARTIAIVAQCLGLRASELFALQWQDFSFDKRTVNVTRGIVNGRVNTVKTEYARDELPIDEDLVKVLMAWKERAPVSPEGWVFANPDTLKPYYPKTISRYLRRAGNELGIDGLGWHTFRHTYRTWLDASGAPIGVQQKLMRHAQVSTTMNTYGNALMESKREANRKAVRLALQGIAKSPEETRWALPVEKLPQGGDS